MNEPPEPYRVSYSDRVLEHYRKLLIRAKGSAGEAGLRRTIPEMHSRLRIYPQFGEPLRDLSAESAQLWIGTSPPLVQHYIIDEERRQVIVARPPMLLPNSGLDSLK